MRTTRLVLVSFLVLVLAGVVFASGDDKLMKEVKALGDALAEAMLANDVETMLSMYAEDAISLPNYSPRMDGKDAFRQHHAEMSSAGIKIKSFESEPTDVWEAGNQVIEIGHYKIVLDMPGMPGIEDKGKYMTVYVRQGKSLKIKAETWNTDVNPMMAAGEHGDHGEHE
jgi:uncharacterized protein (TIGR02246 family)